MVENQNTTGNGLYPHDSAACLYHAIDEKQARIAHEMNSFRPFVDGRVTSEYRASVIDAAQLAEKCKAGVDAMYHDRIDGLLNAYSRRLAAWFNKGFSIDARCPSVMVSGAGNFPTRRKEKQNAARDRHWKEYEEIKELLEKMGSVGHGGISSDDPDALEKLRAKLAGDAAWHERMKEASAWWRKHRTIEGFPGMTDEERDFFRSNIRYACSKSPVPPYELRNSNARMKAARERIATLERAQARLDETLGEGDWGECRIDTADNRVVFLFPDKPDEETRKLLKNYAFRWSPGRDGKPWVRQLTDNAVFAAKEIIRIMALQ
jgi:hypothetical protein